MRIQIICAISTLFISLSTARAQGSPTGNWFIYFGNQALNKKWNWHNEIQYRNYNLIGDLEQLLVRTGLGYNLTENNNNILMGYGFIRTERYVTGTEEKKGSSEHRLYQQYITRQAWGRFFIQHRYRFEQRFLTDDFKLRLRYFIALNVPINHKVLSKNTWYLSAYNEIFLQPKTTVFDRNRIYGALGYMIRKNIRAEIGYMTQLLEKPGTNRSQLQLVLFNNLPISTTK